MRQDGDLAEGSSERIWDKDLIEKNWNFHLLFTAGSLEVEVEDKWPDQKEAEKKIKDAIAEIDATFLAENESLDQIYRDVQISEVYQDGQVEADWSFDDYTYVSADGKLKTEELEEDTLVGASVLLSCAHYQEIYDFLLPVSESCGSAKEGLLRQIQKMHPRQSRESGDIVLRRRWQVLPCTGKRQEMGMEPYCPY